MKRALLLIVLIAPLTACNPPKPAATAASAPAAGEPAPAPSAAQSPPPDLSGQPVVGTVESAQGAATVDPTAPAPPAAK